METRERIRQLQTAMYFARTNARNVEYDLFAMRDDKEFWAKYQPIHKMLLEAAGALDTAYRAMLDAGE